jgi:hypothetical protein
MVPLNIVDQDRHRKSPLAAASMAITASQKFEGPRLDDLDVNLADYGAPLPRFWGSAGSTGAPIIFAEKLKEKKKTTKRRAASTPNTSITGRGRSRSPTMRSTRSADLARPAPLLPGARRRAAYADPRRFFQDRHRQRRHGGPPVKLTPVRTCGSISAPRTRSRIRAMRPGARTATASPDMAPAFKGVAYLVFIDIPLEKFGNRLPQVSIEAVRTKLPAYPFETFQQQNGGISGFNYSPDFSQAWIAHERGFDVVDMASRTRLFSTDVEHTVSGPVRGGMLVVNGDGTAYIPNYQDNHIALVTEGGAVAIISDTPMRGGMWSLDAGLWGVPTSGNVIFQLGGGGGGTDPVETIACTFAPNYCFNDANGGSWASGSSGSNIVLAKLGDSIVEEHVVPVATSGGAYAMDNGAGGFLVLQANSAYIIDKETFTITAGPVAVSSSATGNNFKGVLPGDEGIWLGFTRYSTRDLSVLEAVSSTNWTSSGGFGLVYDRINNALWGQAIFESFITIRFLDRVSSDGVRYPPSFPTCSPGPASATMTFRRSPRSSSKAIRSTGHGPRHYRSAAHRASSARAVRTASRSSSSSSMERRSARRSRARTSRNSDRGALLREHQARTRIFRAR